MFAFSSSLIYVGISTYNLMARRDLHRCRWRFLGTARLGVLAVGVKPTARSRIEEIVEQLSLS